ncbi:MAG TPA: hypothetical protein VH370_27035 [Humisphaera sp.]|nr:hypothetical protein [Humisphaera sp.]
MTAPKKWARILTGRSLVCVWAAAVCFGSFEMVRYQMKPAPASAAVAQRWPSSLDLTPSATTPTLVVSLHPQCPCSRATVHELAELMSRAKGRLSAYVLFVKPSGAPADWLDGDLMKLAKAIPNISVVVDEGGRNAAALGATTSGQTIVYDVTAKVQFNGGITDGRGHEGENAGLAAILAIVRDGKSQVSETPVYGCSLGVCSVAAHGKD